MNLTRTSVFFALALAFGVAAGAQEQDPDSRPQPGVPKGEVLKFTFDKSKVFPGTVRDYWVYVPAQYRPEKPACLYVNQDGLQWNAPVVFDNLIHKGEMPVTIGVFVMHGRVLARDGNKALDRFNRSYEYDGLGDSYARFIIDELIPEVETKKASDGRALRISKDGNDHAIGGASSGAVCAFTAAWERPDYFSRVWSAIGTYVGLRGADRYPTLIRKYEPKPIRVFLQDGANDLNIYAGDWWEANQMMERALVFAGYEVNHSWGEGGHSGQHGTRIFPEVMRWLWKGYPARVAAGQSRNSMMNEILVKGQTWQPAGAIPALDPSGPRALAPQGAVYSLEDGRLTLGSKRVGGIRGADLVALGSGSAYVMEPAKERGASSRIWLVSPDGKKKAIESVDYVPTAVTVSPDQTLLYVADGASRWVYSYQIQPDGTLSHGQRYFWLHEPDYTQDAGARGMCTDRDGRLYVATRLGVQVCDQAGRVNCILPVPGGEVTGVRFGGPGLDTLYVVSQGRVFSRKLAVRGAEPWGAPNKPAAPRL